MHIPRNNVLSLPVDSGCDYFVIHFIMAYGYLAMRLHNFAKPLQCFDDLICLIVLKMKGFILPYKDLS